MAEVQQEHVTISFCYSTTPERLLVESPRVTSLKLKGKPRAAMYNLIPENWGGFATPWVNLLHHFHFLSSLHFRRMVVSDADLEAIANVKGNDLHSLKLDKCSGFSTDGLLHIAQSCRHMKILFLQESTIEERSGDWLHQLAINNNELRTLNFYMTYLENINIEDLQLIANNCTLKCLKINECEPHNIADLFRAAPGLEEFTGGGPSNDQLDVQNYPVIPFRAELQHLGLCFIEQREMPMFYPATHLLTSLDLLCALLGREDTCALIQRCPNLEALEVRDVIGDQGLETLSAACAKLRRLRIERGEDEGLGDEQGGITQRGLIALSHGCRELQYLAVYVSDITNEALESIGSSMRNMLDFRLVLLDREDTITDLPLDNGVRTLLAGCQHLQKFALYLRKGGLTDIGLQYIGEYSQNVKWMLLGHLGETDQGFLAFSRGCPSLMKLEMRGCPFSGRALAHGARQMRSLKFLWVQGFVAANNRLELLDMARDDWYIEIIGAVQEGQAVVVRDHSVHVLAYYSLAGERTDYPEDGSVIPLRVPGI